MSIYDYDAGGNSRTLYWVRVLDFELDSGNVPAMPLEKAVEELRNRYKEGGKLIDYRIRRRWSHETIYPEALGL